MRSICLDKILTLILKRQINVFHYMQNDIKEVYEIVINIVVYFPKKLFYITLLLLFVLRKIQLTVSL